MRNALKILTFSAFLLSCFLVNTNPAMAQSSGSGSGSGTTVDDCYQELPDDLYGQGATGANPTDPKFGAFQQDLAGNLNKAADDNISVYMAGSDQVPKLDLEDTYCLGTIMDAFNTAVTFMDSSSIVGAIVSQLIVQIFQQITQNCNNIATSIGNFAAAGVAKTQICLPRPQVNLGKIQTQQWPSQPCNGVAVAGLKTVPMKNLNKNNLRKPPTFGPIWGLSNPRQP